jgi:peroxiredoxin
MRLKDVLVSIFSLALLASLVVLWLSPAGVTRVPPLTLFTLQGEKLAIPDSAGRPQLVVFWATTCRSCIKEIPGLVDLYRELGPHGLEIIGVAMQYDRPDQVIAVSKSRKIPYPVALDIHGNSARAFGDVRLTPTSFLVAADGRILHQTVGEINMDNMRTMIVALLEQKKLAQADSAEESHHAVD